MADAAPLSTGPPMNTLPASAPAGLRVLATGLGFPEGPIAMSDGSVLLLEVERQTLTRVHPNGSVEVVARIPGGPNGGAIGPDGACYVCNNGGARWVERHGFRFPTLPSEEYQGGSIQKVDLETGEVTTLYTHCNGRQLNAPNDLVFDAAGGFWFSDHGKIRRRDQDRGGVYYAKSDGSLIREVIFPISGPNGIGLAPDEGTLYVAETPTARLWAFVLAEPGVIDPDRVVPVDAGRCIFGFGGYRFFDSLALDRYGNISIATLIGAGVVTVTPEGQIVEWVALPDRFPTNICFGGTDLATAFITLGGTGRLVSIPWARPGLPLNYLNK